MLTEIEEKCQILLAKNIEPKRLYIGTSKLKSLLREIEKLSPNLYPINHDAKPQIRGLDIIKTVQDDYLEVE